MEIRGSAATVLHSRILRARRLAGKGDKVRKLYFYQVFLEQERIGDKTIRPS